MALESAATAVLAVERNDIGAGEDEALAVASDRVAQPVGARERADEGVEPVGLDVFLAAPVVRSSSVNFSKWSTPLPATTSVCKRTSMFSAASDALDEVTRHRLAPASHRGRPSRPAGLAGQVQRGLPCRVGCADHIDVVAVVAAASFDEAP